MTGAPELPDGVTPVQPGPSTGPAQQTQDPDPITHPSTGGTRRVSAVVLIASIAVLRNALAPALGVYADVIAGLLAATATLVAARWWARHHHQRLGLTNWTTGLAHGAAFAAMVAAALGAAVVIPQTRQLLIANAPDTYPPGMWVTAALLIVPAGTVVFEEVFFRGVLWSYLRSRANAVRTLLLTSAAFAAWHVPGVLLKPEQAAGSGPVAVLLAQTLTVTFAGGLVFGWLRLRTGSLAAPVIAHVATNSFGYLALALAT